MQMIAIGELHSMDGSTVDLFARFVRVDGATMDLPISQEQLSQLAQFRNSSGTRKQAAAPPRQRQAAPPRQRPEEPPASLLTDEVDDDGPLQLGVTAYGDDE